MKTVKITFAGARSDEIARRFFSYMVDGGLEDQMIQQLSDAATSLEITDCNSDDLVVLFQCRPGKTRTARLKSVT